MQTQSQLFDPNNLIAQTDSPKIYPYLGRWLTSTRQTLGLSIAQVAAKMGKHASWVAMLEQGVLSPRSQDIEELAEALNCDSDRLYLMVARIPPRLAYRVGHAAMYSLYGDLMIRQLEETANRS